MTRKTCETCQHNVIGMAIDQLEPDHRCQGCVKYDLWESRAEPSQEQTLADLVKAERKRGSVAGGPGHVLATLLGMVDLPAAAGEGPLPAAGEKPLPARTRQVGGDHYKEAGVEPWDVVGTWPIEQQIGAYRHGALKYLMRAGRKAGQEMETEIAKAEHYIQKLLEVLRDAEYR